MNFISEKSLFENVELLADEKSIPRESVVSCLLSSIESALSTESDLPIKVLMNGENIDIYTTRQVVDEPIGFEEIDISILEANKDKAYYTYDELEIGSFIKEHIKSINKAELVNLNRSTIELINKDFKSRLLQIEKEREYNIFKEKKGELVSGFVSRIEAGNIVVNLDMGEGFLSKHEIIPREFFNFGASIQAYIYDVVRDPFRYQIMLSRTKPEFVGCLMSSMIPEIENGLIEIKAIARDEGNRCKVAVFSEYQNVDPVGSCIGRDGIRIKAIRSAISDERIDVIRWNEDPAIFLSNALSPIEVTKFIFHSEKEVEAILTEDNMNKAKAHRRQQIKLAARLTKFRIKITSQEEDNERSQKEYNLSLESFNKLGLNELQIRLLLNNDIRSIEDLLESSDEEIHSILLKDSNSNFSISELKQKAQDLYHEMRQKDYNDYGIDLELLDIPHVSPIPGTVLFKHKITNKSLLSELDSDEILDILSHYMSDDPSEMRENSEDIVRWSRSKGSSFV